MRTAAKLGIAFSDYLGDRLHIPGPVGHSLSARPRSLSRTARLNTAAARGSAPVTVATAKALRGLKDWEQPEVINTDKAPTYVAALAELKAEGKCPNDTQHRQVKYLNNIVEADYGRLKRLIRRFHVDEDGLRDDQRL
jgi:hypothetical protein